MENWFDQSATTEKRQEIAELIVYLSGKNNNSNTLLVPTLQFLPENYSDTSRNIITPGASENLKDTKNSEVPTSRKSRKEDYFMIQNQKISNQI